MDRYSWWFWTPVVASLLVFVAAVNLTSSKSDNRWLGAACAGAATMAILVHANLTVALAVNP